MRGRRRRLCRRYVVVAGLLVTGLMMGACGEKEGSTIKQTTDRPSMETILDDYTQMRTEMLAAVDEIAGRRDWQTGTTDQLSASACKDSGPGGEGAEATLPSAKSRGSLTGADRAALAEAVWAVGRAHGFDRTGTTVDRTDDLEIYGEDAYGGRYVFGTAENTVLGIRTGCHVWDTPPSQAAVPTGIPDYAKKNTD